MNSSCSRCSSPLSPTSPACPACGFIELVARPGQHLAASAPPPPAGYVPPSGGGYPPPSPAAYARPSAGLRGPSERPGGYPPLPPLPPAGSLPPPPTRSAGFPPSAPGAPASHPASPPSPSPPPAAGSWLSAPPPPPPAPAPPESSPARPGSLWAPEPDLSKGGPSNPDGSGWPFPGSTPAPGVPAFPPPGSWGEWTDPAEVPPAPRRRSISWPLVFAGLTVLLAIAVVATVVVGSSRPKPVAVTYPPAWDPRVRFAVDYVEAEKGSPFSHPVTVNFIPADEFEKDMSSTEGTSDDDKADLDRSAGMMRAFGLAKGHVDLAGQTATLQGASVLAYYDPTSEQVYVRGTTLDQMVRSTLVHELTHAWQDQRYDLERLDGMTDSEARLAFRAVVEGDAENVEDSWVDTLPEAEQQEHRTATEEGSSAAEEKSRSVLSVLTIAMAAPYVFGPSFLQGIAEGNLTIESNRALASPPVNSAELLRPWTYGRKPSTWRAVEAPPVTEGREGGDVESMGALQLYLMLADRIDLQVALAAADAWTGDRFRMETGANGEMCVNGTVTSTGPAGIEAVAAGLSQWKDAFTNGRVTVESDGDEVRYVACDPGESAAVTVPDRAMLAITLPIIRVQMWAQMKKAGATPAQAECLATGMVRLLSTDEMLSPESLTAERGQELALAVAPTCR